MTETDDREWKKIDWEAMWRRAFEKYSIPYLSPEFWDSRAAGFNRWLMRDFYTKQMLKRIKIPAGSTILEVGCGTGNLAVVLARKASRYTALDFSPEMLRHLKDNAARAGLDSIVLVNKDWSSVTVGRDVAVHDVVIASGSLISRDIRQFIVKLNKAARRKVYLTWEICRPFNDETYRLIGRAASQFPDFIPVYNLLYSMGLYASVEVVDGAGQTRYSSLDQALEYWRWKTGGLSEAEEQKLTEHFSKCLEKRENGLRPKKEKHSKWALISWDKS